MKNSWMMIKKQLGLVFLTSLLLLSATLTVKSTALANNVAITPVNGILYTNCAATLYADPSGEKLVSTLPINTPLTITGQTSVGYFEVTIEKEKYYIIANEVAASKTSTSSKTINAEAALVGNAVTGEIYFNQDAYARRAPASTTKIMTALLVYEAIARGELYLETPVIISQSAISGLKSDASHVTPRLKENEIMTVQSLLECVMLKSDCSACNVLAETVAGSVPAFVVLMNKRAAELGCIDTNFVNTHGYPAENHYTNAYSLFLISREAIKYKDFVSLVATQSTTIPATNLTAARTIKTTNELIKADSQYYNQFAFGLKTGSAKSSGLCMVAGATHKDRIVISVVLGAQKVKVDGVTINNQFFETNKLLNMGLVHK